MFKVGQRVVCTGKWPRASWRDRWDRFWHPYESAVAGNIYTISNIYRDHSRIEMLELLELPSPETKIWCAGFFASGFRPVVDDRKKVSFTAGAPADSEKWDNRIRIPARKRETVR